MTQTPRHARNRAPRRTAATPAEPRAPRSWWRLIALLIGALAFLFPFYYMIIGSLQKKPDTVAERRAAASRAT